MGHQRLGKLPQTKAWKDVVSLIAAGADVAEVAAATSHAAEQSMIVASEDEVVRHTVWLLARLPLAAREDDFNGALARLGLRVGGAPTLVDIVCAAMEAVDRAISRPGHRSDYGEIAQLSAAEALYAVVGKEMNDLFGPHERSLKGALGQFAIPAQFAVLARDFFARLTRRHFDYFLSRELARHVGPGRRFPSIREHRAFEEALDAHCRETTRIIKEYATVWHPKQTFEGGIDRGKAARFLSYATEKIRDELRHRRGAYVA